VAMLSAKYGRVRRSDKLHSCTVISQGSKRKFQPWRQFHFDSATGPVSVRDCKTGWCARVSRTNLSSSLVPVVNPGH
jgi:hypothetical protein